MGSCHFSFKICEEQFKQAELRGQKAKLRGRYCIFTRYSAVMTCTVEGVEAENPFS